MLRGIAILNELRTITDFTTHWKVANYKKTFLKINLDAFEILI